MTQFLPTQDLGKQIYNALQGEIVEKILKFASDGAGDDYWRSHMEGLCMKVERDILPEIFTLCREVKEKLGFKESVNFYVTGDSALKAFSIVAEEAGKLHIVDINSALFELMCADELRFVVGHELGRIINKDSWKGTLRESGVLAQKSMPPITLQYRIELIQRNYVPSLESIS